MCLCLCLVRNIPYFRMIFHITRLLQPRGDLLFIERLCPWTLLFSTTFLVWVGQKSSECHEHSYALTRMSREQTEYRVNHSLCSCQGALYALNRRCFMPCSSMASIIHVLAGAEGLYNSTLYQLCMADTSAKQNKGSVTEICVISGASSMTILSLLVIWDGLPFHGWQDHSTSFTTLVY